MAKVDVNKLEGGGDPNIYNTGKAIDINSVNVYTFMDHAFTGTGGFRNGKYLIPHSREMFFASRMQLAFYKNFVKPIINAMVRPVFSDQVARKVIREGSTDEKPRPDTESLFNDFIWDCDNAGTYLQSYTHKTITKCRLHGLVFTVVDNFPQDQQPQTTAEAREGRVFPYVYMKAANQVKRWTLDKFGNIETIMFRDVDIIRRNERTGKDEVVETWREWDSMKSVQYIKTEDKDGAESFQEVETVEHGLGVVPVIVSYSLDRQDLNHLMVDPPAYDIARLNHTIFNTDSEIRELERSQGFAVFYIQSDTQSPTFTSGPWNVLWVPTTATMPPGFAAPDANIQKNLMEHQGNLREDLFRIAEQNGVIGVQSSKSGIALQWEFFAHESVLKKTSMLATELEEKISEIFKLYTGETFTYLVDYPDSFQPNDKLGELKQLDQLQLMEMPAKATAMIKEKAFRVMFADEDPDKIEAAVEEIHETAEDEIKSREEARKRAKEETDEDEPDEPEPEE